MKKAVMNDMFGRGKLDKPLKVRCPFCSHTFPPETIQIVGITEEQTNFVILVCPNAKCRTILEIIPQYSIGITKQNNK
jgi:hypothetical protein